MGAAARVRRRRPKVSYEAELEIRTSDGVALRAIVGEPKELRGTIVLAHSLFARKSSFRSLAPALEEEGFRTIAFDFRGHGESDRPDWSYDDLVRFDLPCVVDCARARAEDLPVFVLGHSLGGHTALASQGAGLLKADGVIAVGASVWTREFEPSIARWAVKKGIARIAREAVKRAGRIPARSLRIGSDDASAQFVSDFFGFMDRGAWQSADGTLDYAALLSEVRVPVCAVASEGDHVICHPDAAAAFVRRCAGAVEVKRITRSDDGSRPPGHMTMVTTDRARSVMLDAVRWTLAAARP